MSTTFQSLRQHLDRRGVKYMCRDQEQHLLALFQCRRGAFQVLAAVTDDDKLLQVFVHPGFQVPDGARAMISELVTRANYGLKIGKFEFNLNDGELRYQAAAWLPDGGLCQETVDFLMGVTLETVDAYIPAFLSCIWANESPADAIRHVELAG